MERLFGPIQGPGVSVRERAADQPIAASALGWVAWAGILERGPTDELIFMSSGTDARKKTGNLTADSLMPDCLSDFFSLYGGSGGVIAKRVTSGTELPAQTNLYARRSNLRTKVGELKAKNGGRWGGFAAKATGDVAVVATDVTETTLITGLTMWNADQWEGAYIELAGVPNVRYQVIGSDAAGVLTVASDYTMASDLAAGGDPTNARWYLVLDGRNDRGLEYTIDDGELNPASEFNLAILLDGEEVARWNDLSMDPASASYWVELVNSTDTNEYVEAIAAWDGAVVPNVRPANGFGLVDTLTATVLNANVSDFSVSSPTGGNPTFLLGATTDIHVSQTITVTMSTAIAGAAVSDKFGALGAVTLGSLFEPNNKWTPTFTVTAGATPLAADDTLTVQYKPLGTENELVSGFIFPDKVSNPDKRYRIISSTHKSVTVAVGSDMATDVAGGGDEFMIVAPQRLFNGRDGHADVTDNDYIQAFDVDNSLFKRIVGRGLGLVKFACPGVTSTPVQKAGAAYVSSGKVNASQWRYEVPSNLTSEFGVENHVNNVLGKSPFGDYVVTLQSFAYVTDPEAAGKLKLVPTVGMIQGRESAMAAAFNGYHKAAAGIGATLPRIVKLNTGEAELNEEFLTPRGINTIARKGGSFVLWGDRSVTSNTAWSFKHQREVMSYYINVLRESFDFSVFEINDTTQWARVRSSLISFFRPQYNNRALDNSLPFDQALVIKIDGENNTDATKAAGNLNVAITVSIVNTIERLQFNIGKAGVQETGA